MPDIRAIESRVNRLDYQLSALVRNINIIPALNDAQAALLVAGGIDTSALADGAVTTVKLGNLSVTGAKIANATVTNANIANATITDANIASATITNALIADATIASAKIASLQADKITAGSGIINNLTINAVLTIGAGGSIVDADGSTWDQNVLRLVSAGAVGDAFVLKVGASDRAYISANSSNNAIFGLNTSGPTSPTSLLLSDGKAVIGFEGLGFNTLRPRVQVETGGVAITGNTTPTYGGGVVVMFISEAATVPTTNPTGGIILYVESGTLKARTSSGNIRTIALV